MMSYLLLNIFIILIPFVLSFEQKLKFYKNWAAYGFSIAIVSTLFIFWDVFATHRGDWAFNPIYTIGLDLFGLPIEEILFFITVPYSIIFIYETLNAYIEDYYYSTRRTIFIILSILFFILSFIVIGRNYTYVLFLFISLSFFLMYSIKDTIAQTQNFWLTIVISYIPFLIVNYLLTSIPIVTYNDLENFGIRLITIPIEDFGYSFAMNSMWLLFYDIGKKLLLKNE